MRYCKTKIVAMPIPSTDDVAQIKAEKVMEEKQAEEVRAFLMSTQKQILNEKNLFQKWKMQLKVLS